METNKVSRTASGLHMVSSMKRVAVAILAMVVASGCGVGADEYYDGQTLVASTGQALEQAPEVAPVLPTSALPQPPETTAPAPLRDPSIIALPQDPIPVYEGMPGPRGAPMLDSTFDPKRGPTPQPGIR